MFNSGSQKRKGDDGTYHNEQTKEVKRSHVESSATEDILEILSPSLKAYLYDHQKEAISFLSKNIVGTPFIEKNEDVGSGVILAHSMGLGKTATVIAFIYGILTDSKIQKHIKKVLIICPVNVNEYWLDEFKSEEWKKHFEKIPRTVRLSSELKGERSVVQDSRCLKIKEWYKNDKETKIMIMGYDVYNNLVNGPTTPKDKKQKAKFKPESGEEKETRNEIISYLRDPGPDVVIFDEAHLLKNNKSKTHKTKDLIKTGRRILLTGTLMPNNISELYNLVSFVDKDKTILGDEAEFMKNYGDHINAGKCTDTLPEQGLAERKTKELHNILRKSVMHTKDENYLKELINIKKTEITIMLKPTAAQEQKYKAYFERDNSSKRLFNRHHYMMDTNTHPSLAHCDETDSETQLSPEDDDTSLSKSKRMHLLFEIINKCREKSEKLVVFSEKHNTLDYIEKQLENAKEPLWKKKKNYFRIDGKTSASQRKLHFNDFNDKKEAFLCLLTTRAASVGCSLVGSNRMVIIDHTFNPSFNMQATCRIYRIKQTKPVFIYRLVVPYTSEHTTYKGQITKESQSLRVVYKKEIAPQFEHEELIHIHGYEPVEHTVFCEEKLELVTDPLVKEVIEKNKAALVNIENHGEHFNTDKITIKLVFPDGKTKKNLSISVNQPVKILFNFCEDFEFSMSKYRLLTSDYPKKDVAMLDTTKSFRELKWPTRELITMSKR